MLDYPSLVEQCVDYLWFRNSIIMMLSFFCAAISFMYWIRKEKKKYGTTSGFICVFSVFMLLIYCSYNFCLLQWPQAIVTRYLLGG